MKLGRTLKAYIETELRDYDNTKRLWEEEQCNVIEGGDRSVSDMPRGGNTSNPTMDKAIKLYTNKRLAQLERTIKAIERVMSNLPEEKYRLVVLRYWTQPRILTDDGIAAELCCSRATLYNWVDGIIYAVAKELGQV